MNRFLTLFVAAGLVVATSSQGQEPEEAKAAPTTTSAEDVNSSDDSESASASETAAEPESEPVPESDATDAGKPKPNGRVFKPSEEISEGSPVPFPVDI